MCLLEDADLARDRIEFDEVAVLESFGGAGDADERVKLGIHMAINGIAAALRNTG